MEVAVAQGTNVVGGESAKSEAALLWALIDHLDAMVAYWNQDLVCEVANAAYRDWFGKNKHEVIGITMQQLLGPLYEKNLPYIRAVLRGEKQVFEREIPLPGGGSRHSLATYVPHVVDGQVRGFFAHVADVTPLKRLEQELQRAKSLAEAEAAHDALTGLPNRRRLEATVEREMAAASLSHSLVAVMAIDLDNFKAVNDRFGHAGGDRYLVEVAARLRSCLRAEDTLFRLGGDEFVAVVTGLAHADEGHRLGLRMLEAVRSPARVDGHVEQPAVSIGVALYPRHGNTLVELLAAADRALYQAKAAGRNQQATCPDP